MEFHLIATDCHLSYGITQCYLPLYTSDHTLPYFIYNEIRTIVHIERL